MTTKSQWATLPIHTVVGKETTPNNVLSFTATGALFQIDLNWAFDSEGIYSAVEIWGSITGSDRATAVKLTDISYPTSQWSHIGVGTGQQVWYWIRTKDKAGNYSDWSTVVTAISSSDASEIKSLLNQQISESELTLTLKTRIDDTEQGVADLELVYGDTVSAASSATAAAQSASDAVVAKTAAETAAGNANTSATSAETYKVAAETAKTDAQAASTAAATSASSAASYATSAETASTAATNAKVAAESAKGSAESSATAAATSASTASTKATEASTSATSAATSATTASTKAGEASTSATNAATSETNASGSANEAATSATNAATSATSAGNSATSASTSASNASTSATAASNSATSANSAKVSAESARDSAQTSATAAATSATNANTSATDAATSASTATTKANEANTSAANALTYSQNAASSATTAEGHATASAQNYSALSAQIDQNLLFKLLRTYSFASGTEGFTSSLSTISAANGVLSWTTTGTNPTLTKNFDAADYFTGSQYTKVRARVRRTVGTQAWEGNLYYTTAGHGIASGYRKQISVPTNPTSWNILEWDMSALTEGGTDWVNSTIRSIRLDLVGTSGDTWEIDWISIGEKVYQAGAMEVVTLEQKAIVTADTLTGLSAQYTVKVDNNGHVSGFGLASTVVNGTPTSDFTILADKFAVVTPGVVKKYPFVVGTVNGQTTVGIDGTLVVDGSIIAQKIDSRGLSIKDAQGNVILSAGVPIDWTSTNISNKPTSLSGINTAEGSKLSGIEAGATSNIVTFSDTAPTSPGEGDLWVDTSGATDITKAYVGGTWQISANYTTNTNQLTDGAGLGTTATWSGVTGSGKPDDYASSNDANVLPDGNFAKHAMGGSYWSLPAAGSITATQGENSTPGLKITANGTVLDALSNNFIPAQYGDVFYVRARVFVEAGSNGDMSIGISTFNASKQDLSNWPNFTRLGSASANIRDVGEGSWQWFEGKVTVSNLSASYIKVRPTVRNTATAGSIIFSDIWVSRSQYGATKGATWGVDVNSIPYDTIYSNDDAVALGFNPTFSKWTGTYPDGWALWNGTAPTKETTVKRVGDYSLKYVAAGGSLGMYATASFTTNPLPAGTFASGTVDIYLGAVTTGLPGVMVRLYTNSGFTTYVDTKVQPPSSATGAWHRVPWTARVGAGAQIYGIRIYIMASWNEMPSGGFTGTCYFDNLRFALFDSSVDNKSVSIGADGSLTGGGGGQVTITGLGYNGALNAQANSPSLGAKINYNGWSTANAGEVWLHGFDKDGNAANVAGWVSVNGVKHTVPYGKELCTNIGPAAGYIMLDTAGETFVLSSGLGNRAFAFTKRTGTGQWQYDDNGAWINFTPASTHFIIGTLETDAADSVKSASVWGYGMVPATASEPGATKNTIYRQSTTPASSTDGDVWVDTSATPNVTKVKISGSWQISSNYTTNTNELTDGANLGKTADYELIRNKGGFLDTFESGDASQWQNYSGTGEVSVVSVADSQTGGKVLRVGNNSGNDMAWLIHKVNIPFDPNALYKLKFRVRRTAGTGTAYLGVAGVAADGVTLVNRLGSNLSSDQHYVASVNASPGSSWTTYTAYVKGTAATGDNTVHANIEDPAVLHSSTRYFRPLILVNYSGVAGTTEVDFVSIENLTEAVTWNNVSGTGKPADNATKNTVTYSTTAPASPTDGDIWVDTLVTPNVTKVRVSGAWQISSNYTTNTTQLTDGANLGGTAVWTGVTNRPDDALNLCEKATFEDGSRGGWNAGTVVSVTGQAFSKALQVGQRDTTFGTTFPVTPGETLYVEATADASLSNYVIGLGLRFMSSADVTVAWNRVTTSAAGSGWATKTGKVTVPSTAVKAYPWIQMDGQSGFGTALFTNLKITRFQQGATNTTITYSASAPASPNDGDTWVDTSVTPNVTKVRVAGAWQVAANYTTGTSQLTDDANLGGTATWSGVSGTGKPADNATRNVHRGDWVADTAYAVGDAVIHGGYGWSCLTAHTSSVSVTPPTYPTTSNANWTLAAVKGSDGGAAITASLSNEAHTFPAATDGTVSSYLGSGTRIYVYEGATALDYDGVGTANGKWKITSSALNITPGSLTDSGTYLTVNQHSGLSAANDAASITYNITGKTLSGVSFSISKTQTFSKSKAGATGAQGPAVVATPDRAATFTATDGVLDGAQADIVFTATTSGLTSPTYAWSFTRLDGSGTAPTASSTSTYTVTAANMGTSKGAVVTCTVNGSYVDKVTIVRLEKSTAVAGATKNVIYRQSTTPASSVDGDIWVDTSTTPETQRVKVSGSWQVASTVGASWGSNITNQPSDQALLNTSAAFSSYLTWDFRNSGEGWNVTNWTSSVTADTLSLVGAGADPQLYISGLSINGGLYDKVRARIRRVSGSQAWEGILFYATGSHSWSSSYRKQISNANTLTGWHIVEWDMAALTAGGTDWTSNTITGLRLDLVNTTGDTWEIDWISVGKYGTAPAEITADNVGTWIDDAAIGSAQIGSIALVGTSNFSVKSAASGARMEMDSRAIKVFDASGVKRVQLGDLTA